MENNYYDLREYLGQEIIDLRNRVKENDRVLYPKFYDIEEIQPDKRYMASIIFEDISMLTTIYKEEIIYEI